MTGYKIVMADSPYELARSVQEEMSSGWQPIGGPLESGGHLMQAVVHPSEKFDPDWFSKIEFKD